MKFNYVEGLTRIHLKMSMQYFKWRELMIVVNALVRCSAWPNLKS